MELIKKLEKDLFKDELLREPNFDQIEDVLDVTKYKCTGCGANFQTKKEKEKGYVPPSVVKTYVSEIDMLDDNIMNIIGLKSPDSKLGDVICQRCYLLKHYGKVAPIEISPKDFSSVIHQIKTTKGLVVKVVDISDFEGSMIHDIRRYIGSNPVMIVATKFDILPHGATEKRIISWIRKRLSELKLNVVDIMVTSGTKGLLINELSEKIEYHRQGMDVYVIGQSNAGKSTLINRMLHDFGSNEKTTTASPLPGTTISKIGFKIGENSFLYDTPGIINESIVWNYLEPKEIKYVMPSKRISPYVYRINPGTSILIGGLARIDFIEGPLMYFTVYANTNIKLLKGNTESAGEAYKKELGVTLKPPFTKFEKTLSTRSNVIITPRNIMQFRNQSWDAAFVDIVWPGIGWCALTGGGTIKIKAWAPRGTDVFTREPLMPFDAERKKTKLN